MNEKISLDSIKSYTEMRSELYKWVRKFLNEKVGKEISSHYMDYWRVDSEEVYIEYYDEDEDDDRSIFVHTEEFLEFVNKSK